MATLLVHEDDSVDAAGAGHRVTFGGTLVALPGLRSGTARPLVSRRLRESLHRRLLGSR